MSNKIYSLETRTWIDNQAEDKNFYEDDLYENPSVRIPVMFCIDTGKAMFDLLEDGQTKLDETQETVRTIVNAFSSDGLKNNVDFSIVTYSDDVACEKYFSCTGNHPYEVKLAEKSYSSLGTGVKLAANLLRQRIEEYRQAGVEYKSPFMFIFYGSKADKDDPSIDEASGLVKFLSETEDLNVFPVNVGSDDAETLSRFALEKTFEKYGNVDFENFLNLVSGSVSFLNESSDYVGNNIYGEDSENAAEGFFSESNAIDDVSSDDFPEISPSFEEINNL